MGYGGKKGKKLTNPKDKGDFYAKSGNPTGTGSVEDLIGKIKAGGKKPPKPPSL